MAARVVSAADLSQLGAGQLCPPGQLFAFPTDTVYGLGVQACDGAAISKLRAIKSRPAPAPFSLHLGQLDQLPQFCGALTDQQWRWVAQLLPGPYTLLLPASASAPQDAVFEGKIGIRVPAGDAFACVASVFGQVLGTSVNRAGEEPINDPNQIRSVFGDDIALLITSPEPLSGKSSAVIDLCLQIPRVLRGQLPAEFEA